jgi:RNA polymerase sigma-70 factor (ECF subfamily)
VSPNDRGLIEALARGDAAAEREVRGWVRLFLASRAFAVPAEARRDLEQEVVIEVWRAVRRPEFDAERELGGFVRVVAARRAIDWLRGRPPEDEAKTEIEDAAPGPFEVTASRERRERAARALDLLGPACRELVRLQAGEGWSYRRLAAHYGRTEGALRVQMHRCVDRLRRLLLEPGPVDPGAGGRSR